VSEELCLGHMSGCSEEWLGARDRDACLGFSLALLVQLMYSLRSKASYSAMTQINVTEYRSLGKWSGRRREGKVFESEREIDSETLMKVLKHKPGDSQWRGLAYIIRGALDPERVSSMAAQLKGSEKFKARSDGVKLSAAMEQLGTTLYSLEKDEFIAEMRDFRDNLKAIFGEFNKDIWRLIQSIGVAARRVGAIEKVRVGKIDDVNMIPVVIRGMQGRSRVDPQMALPPHEDKSQETVARDMGNEIATIRHTRAILVPLIQPARGGKLRIFNAKRKHVEAAADLAGIDPAELKKTDSPGFYYDRDVLERMSVSWVDVELSPGDICFFAHSFIHAVTAIERGEERLNMVMRTGLKTNEEGKHELIFYP